MEESKSGPSSGPSGSASRQVSSVADVGVFHSWNCPPQRPCSSHRPVWSRPSSPAAFPNPLSCRPLTVTRLSPRFRYYSAVRLLDSIPSHFALAYRVSCRGATRGPAEVSQGHALVFHTVPPANTLVRWVDEIAFASVVQARPCPTFGRPVRHGVAPSTTARYCSANPSDPTSRWAPCPPQFRRGGSRSTLAVSSFRLRARLGISIPATCGRRGITPAFGYGPPHPGAGGTSTLLTSALPGAHHRLFCSRICLTSRCSPGSTRSRPVPTAGRSC